MNNEQWRDIPGYEGLIQVSDMGQVKRIGYVVDRACNRPGMFKPLPTGGGYRSVTFAVNGVRRWFYIHILVMLAFMGPRPHGLVVNHKNGDKTDNRLANLEYVTSAENNRHALRTGLNTQFGETSKFSKLKNEDVSNIRKYYSYGATPMSLARLYGVGANTILQIVKGKAWKHLLQKGQRGYFDDPGY